MPYKEKEIEKMYYSIGEVAELFNVNASLIRFWEKEFDILTPQKSKKGNRQYTPSDIEAFRTIYHLVKERGYTISGAREKLKTGREESSRHAEMAASLSRIRAFLVEVKKQLGRQSQETEASAGEKE